MAHGTRHRLRPFSDHVFNGGTPRVDARQSVGRAGEPPGGDPPIDVARFTLSCILRAWRQRPSLSNSTLIAATALAHGFGVVTNNHDEFSRVPGLAVETF